jgi:DNA modification methylase
MILNGDAIAMLRTLPEGCARTCVTSPPYFGLRDYAHPGQIGLEATPDDFVAKLVEVFREVRRVLRDDGTLWLNLGDSYSSGGRSTRDTGSANKGNAGALQPHRPVSAAKPKDLLGMPWRVAFALQADGWYLRQDIIWHKPNPMPESVTDRCTKAHEYLFLLSKSARYFFDSTAIAEPATGRVPGNVNPLKGVEDDVEKHRTRSGLHVFAERQRSKRDSFKRDDSKRAQLIPGQSEGTHRAEREESAYDTFTRNRRSVWTVATEPYHEAHFATYPPALIRPCVLAGSRPGDVVLDPFAGSGTTLQVAAELGRDFIGIELSPEYVRLIERRLAGVTPGLALA